MLGEFLTVRALVADSITSAGRCIYQQNCYYWYLSLFASENFHLEKLPEACIMLFLNVDVVT
jgi:hypothetical protein